MLMTMDQVTQHCVPVMLMTMDQLSQHHIPDNLNLHHHCFSEPLNSHHKACLEK